MNIHPLWFVCLFVRVSLIFLIRYLKKYNNKWVNALSIVTLLTMGLGFMYNAIFGSNEEYQVSKVFWHETRYVHSMFYIVSGLYLFNNKLDISSILLFLDIVFSILYRIISNQ